MFAAFAVMAALQIDSEIQRDTSQEGFRLLHLPPIAHEDMQAHERLLHEILRVLARLTATPQQRLEPTNLL